MLNTQTTVPKQILLRLPDVLAEKLARSVAPRQRNNYILSLVSRDLESKEVARSRLLTDAALRMNEIEAANPELASEGREWTDAVLTDDENDGRDQETFEREWALSQAAMPPLPQK